MFQELELPNLQAKEQAEIITEKIEFNVGALAMRILITADKNRFTPSPTSNKVAMEVFLLNCHTSTAIALYLLV